MSKPVTIQDVQVITTQPAGSRLVIVKVITSEPGLYGLGCATFTQRFHAVVTAIEKHLKPFVIGRDVSRIEELYRMATVHSYWRNGPVLNNAISGIDQALWDIKGKLANMPVYELLGGKCREAAACYAHANGRSPAEVADNVRRHQEAGYRYIRVQMGGYGGESNLPAAPDNSPSGHYYDPRAYMRNMLDMIGHVRWMLGQKSNCSTISTSGCSPLTPCSLPKMWNSTSSSSSKMPWPPKILSGSNASANSALRRWQWVSCLITRANGSR